MDDNLSDLASAISKVQGKIENAKKANANPFFKSKYADLATVWDAIREELASEGLSVLQFPIDTREGHVGLLTMLLHSSGQRITAQFSMPVKDASNPQAVGSALTYARRYALMAVVGIAPEDDDGNGAKAAPARTSPTGKREPTDPMAGFSDLSDTEKRAAFSAVRNGPLEEPMKTQTLTLMSNIIKGKK